MSDSTDTRSIVAGRTMPHPPEQIRRALTQSCLGNAPACEAISRGWPHVPGRPERVAGTRQQPL